MSDDKIDEEESSSNDYTGYSDYICSIIPNVWVVGKKHINTGYFVTGWILFVIPHIRECVFKNSSINHMNQVNNVIKTLFFWII